MATQWTAGLSDGTALPAATLNQIGAAWETYTPTVTQSGNVTVTVTYAKYARIQKIVLGSIYLTVTGSGTGGNGVSVSLPITALTAGSQIIGSGFIFDASANNLYTVQTQVTTTTTAQFYADQTGSAALWGVTPNVALAVNDQIRTTFIYEAA